jgi:hypothetical protein
MAAVPKAREMMKDVLCPDDGMPRGGKRKTKLSKTEFRRLEGRAFTAFEEKEVNDRARAAAKSKLRASKSASGNTGKLSEALPEVNQTMGYSTSDSNFYKPKHFLQKGFGIGERCDIVKCFGANSDGNAGPGQYDTHLVGMIRWKKEEGGSHPAQMTLTNHKSAPLISFGKPKGTAGSGTPPLTQAPGPGHYGMADFWDPNWQRYPSLGKSFVRKVPHAGESRFGGLARQELRNAKGDMNFLQQ